MLAGSESAINIPTCQSKISCPQEDWYVCVCTHANAQAGGGGSVCLGSVFVMRKPH